MVNDPMSHTKLKSLHLLTSSFYNLVSVVLGLLEQQPSPFKLKIKVLESAIQGRVISSTWWFEDLFPWWWSSWRNHTRGRQHLCRNHVSTIYFSFFLCIFFMLYIYIIPIWNHVVLWLTSYLPVGGSLVFELAIISRSKFSHISYCTQLS